MLAGVNVNVWDVGDDIETLIRSRTEVNLDRLADPDVGLSEVSTQPVADRGKANRGGLGGFLAGRVSYVRRFAADRFTPADSTPPRNSPAEKAGCSTSPARKSPCTRTRQGACMRSHRCAPTPAAWCSGTPPTPLGTAPATAPLRRHRPSAARAGQEEPPPQATARRGPGPGTA